MNRVEKLGNSTAADTNSKPPIWLWIVATIVFAVGFLYGFWLFFVLAIIALFLAILIPIARFLLRHYDRDVSKATRKGNSGDLPGAIEDLRAVIASRGPSAKRLTGLGTLIGLNGDWPEAARILREAFELDPTLVRPKLAVAVWKSGDPQEAEELMAPLIEIPQPQPDSLHNLGLIRLDLGRIEEAEALVNRAETTINNTRYLGPQDIKHTLLAEVSSARDRISALRGEKKVVNAFEEV